jgi:hypothetical protein
MGSNSESRWVLKLLFPVFTLGLCCMPVVRGAEKEKPDLEAESKQQADEDAKEQQESPDARRAHQRIFNGAFVLLAETDNDNPDVLGQFATDNTDKVPGQVYLVKVKDKNPAVVEALKKMNGKKATLHGRLRVDGKYLVVYEVVMKGPTPPAKERRRAGGI